MSKYVKMYARTYVCANNRRYTNILTFIKLQTSAHIQTNNPHISNNKLTKLLFFKNLYSIRRLQNAWKKFFFLLSCECWLSFFRYTNDELRNDSNHRHKHKTWTREDNQLALHCYFKSDPTQREKGTRMIKIWQECVCFQTTIQRLAKDPEAQQRYFK